ncbi:MAG: response regulator [Janthinobacterium lividum]
MTTHPSVLLVDDDRTTNFLHERLLRRLKVAKQVVTTTNGVQALAYLASLGGEAEKPCPSLILLDLRMSVLDGWGFLAAYRRLPFHQRQAPVIVLVVPPLRVAELEDLQRLPVASVLYKPLTTEKVEQILALLPIPDPAILEKEQPPTSFA